MFLGHQHVTKTIFMKNERVEAELPKGSNNWQPARIRAHDDYFTVFTVYFESGRVAKIPPAQIRKLHNHKIEDNASDEAKQREFYKLLGCDDLQKVPQFSPSHRLDLGKDQEADFPGVWDLR